MLAKFNSSKALSKIVADSKLSLPSVNISAFNLKICAAFYDNNKNLKEAWPTVKLKPGLHEPQLPVERRVTLVFSTVVKRRR